MIGFSKELNALEKNKDNKNRRNILKIEKDIIHKQFKIYNSQIQHLKEIDLILDKIKTFNEMESSSKKEKEEDKKNIKEIEN